MAPRSFPCRVKFGCPFHRILQLCRWVAAWSWVSDELWREDSVSSADENPRVSLYGDQAIAIVRPLPLSISAPLIHSHCYLDRVEELDLPMTSADQNDAETDATTLVGC